MNFVTATDLYSAMLADILSYRMVRETTDPHSPTKQAVLEAEPGRSYTYTGGVDSNIVICKQLNLDWAWANVVHFFAATEDAEVLKKYNANAERFLTPDGRLDGAYGPIAVPQLKACAEKLRTSPASRRAVVSMGGFCDVENINKPACPSFMHFLRGNDLNGRSSMEMLVYQRSLSLAVMPYDLVLYSNILSWMAASVDRRIQLRSLRWTIGSLHMSEEKLCYPMYVSLSVKLDPFVIDDPKRCMEILKRGLENSAGRT